MLKRYLIITILLFAYTIVFVHSIIPHHHHHNHKGQATEQSSHHHDDHEDDHHNEDDESLAHHFENFLHSGDNGDFHQQPDLKTSCNLIASAYVMCFFEFNINIEQDPPSVVKHTRDHIPIVQQLLFCKGLRAPPYVAA